MPTGRFQFTSSVVNGKIYVFGNQGSLVIPVDVEEYNPLTDTWRTKAPMPLNRVPLPRIACNGGIYAIGGINTGDRVVEYDPAADPF